MNDRITVSVIPKTKSALTYLAELTGMSQTDLVNRAVQMYRFITEQTAAGNEVLIRRPDGTTEKVTFL